MEDLINLNDVHVEQTSSTNISGESIRPASNNDMLDISVYKSFPRPLGLHRREDVSGAVLQY